MRLTTTSAGTIRIDDGVTLEPGVSLFSDCEVLVQSGVVIGPNVVISDRDARGVSGEVRIERGARIGAGVRILGPCVVPSGTVIAPGRVLPDRAVAVEAATAPSPRATTAPLATTAPRATTATLTGLLLADFTVDPLVEPLARTDVDGLSVVAEVAPFDQVTQTLFSLKAREPKVDVAFVWTRPEAVSPAYQRLLHGEAVDAQQVMADVDAFVSSLEAGAAGARFLLVASWVLPPWRRGLGVSELRSGPSVVLMRMNLRLAEALERLGNVYLLDAQRWLAVASDEGVDPKLWHAGKIAFTTGVLEEAALDVRSALRGLTGGSKKLVVVDLDDTLWGGIVGDVGWEGLLLGGHDPRGEAYVDFQRRLVALSRRGVALAVVSKNEESTALHAMRSHPEMILRPEALAAYRINWRDKAQNIVEIAQELNLGLQSVVFLDDNPVERGRVSEALPEVYVPELPRDPARYGQVLEGLRCFDSARVTEEDLARNAAFATERQRTALRSTTSSIDEWLATLGLVVRFERLSEANLSRAAQLLNKTNQMNLRTRRLSEPELLAWSRVSGHEVWAVYVSDRFGEAGLTGLFGLARAGSEATLEDYLLSCRVMGRRVEETVLWASAERATALGAASLAIVPIATSKNKPCLDFFANARLAGTASGWTIPLDAPRAAPSLVLVSGLE